MPIILRCLLIAPCLFIATSGFCSAAEPKPIAYRGAQILTAAGKVFDPGTLRVEGGKIVAVGMMDDVTIPDGAEVHDAAGKVIIPGLVDTHSHLGVYSRPAISSNSDGNEMTGPVQSVVRALDSLNPFDPGIRMANAGGVTTANIMPGSGNVIGGQTIYVKLRGHTPEQMWIASPDVLGGLKMANGENPKRSYGSKGKAPGTRMKIAALQRAEFLKAMDYRREWDGYRKKLAAGEEVSPPDVDLGLEALVEVLQKKRTVHFHSHRADDLLTTMRLKDEFDFDLVIQHGTESYKIIDEIARQGVPVSMTILDSPGGKAEVVQFLEECGAELAAAGVKVLVNTDDPVTESRFMLRTAAIAVRGGLPEDIALKAVTLHGAEVMHLDDRLGSLEAGKDADFVVLSGPPFSIYARVLETYIDGKRVFDLADESERLFQTGGFAVRDKSQIPPAKPLIAPLQVVEAPTPPAGAAQPDLQSTEFVILAGRLHTVAGESIDDGAVHVRDGKIVFAGPRAELEIAADIPVVAATEVSPGLIDAHSVVPLEGEYNIRADQDSNEESDPNQADVRVLDGFNPSEPLLQFLLQQGITTVHACPGRANVIAGLSGVFHTHGRTPESMTIRFPQAMLFNLGEWPKETYDGRKPRTRMGTASLIREALTGASNFSRKKKPDQDADEVPNRDLKQEALTSVLEKKVPALFCAQRGDDILTALRLTKEFKLEAMIALAADGYLVADQIKTANVPVIVHPTMQRVGGMETYRSFLGNAAALADHKIPIAIGSGVETYVPKTRVIRHEAAMAMVYGLGRARALAAVTLDAAKILNIDDRYGSLEPGKVADIVLYDGDPFEHKTQVTHVIVDGRLVYRRADQPRIPLAQRQFYFSPNIPCCLD
ncbi:amidohydrolase family protein [Symmachiella dynata]|uniref:amidohydrolase family protein n=1 Tax=Symmachiella dynata TaxID=2527995 RepID=UPI0030EC1D59